MEAVWINLSQRCKKIVEKLSETAYKQSIVDKMRITFLFYAFNQHNRTGKRWVKVDNFRFMHGIMLITFRAFCTMQTRGLQAETEQICRSECSRRKYRNKKEARPARLQ